VHNFNRYAYAYNNPYKYTDPDGRDSLGTAIGAWLSGTCMKETAKATHETNMSMLTVAGEAVSFTRGGTIVALVETTSELLSSESIADDLAGMTYGEIAGAVTEKVVEKKFSKEATAVVSAVVGKFSGDGAKKIAAESIKEQENKEQETKKDE
jgi:hypothetical protein